MYGQLVMGLFYKRRNVCIEWESGDLVPTAKKLLKKMFNKIGEYKVERVVAGKLYEVTSIHNTIFTVDLDKHTCSCVQWQLRGFPCQHAVCVLQKIRPNWVDQEQGLFLQLIRKPGRPRKNRRKAYNETLSEKKVRCCSKCKLPGHNKTTCAGGAIASDPKKKRSRSEDGGLTFQAQSSSQPESTGGSLPSTKKPRKVMTQQ